MSKQTEFIEKISTDAQRCQLKMGVKASLTIAQAILESGWGGSELAQKANNYFGIKGAYNGNSYTIVTKEWSKERGYYDVEAAFRKYTSIRESIYDHAQLLQKPRYAKVLDAKDYKEACIEVHKAGYATAPDYAEKLINIIERYGLQKYDTIERCPDCGKPVKGEN